MSQAKSGIVNFLQEFSVPLIAGVFAALAMANVNYELYHHWLETPIIPGVKILGYDVTLHWLVNDIFMVFFFGIAAKEIAEAALPGGSLNPIKAAINPLIATLGGVFGPVAVFFGALYVFHGMDLFDESFGFGALSRGWGIPTATDIALAWLVARTVFGKGHPAINFLLLLAVADDAIGLVIIAVFYGDPLNPAQPQWLALVVAGMAVAYALRRMNVQQWWIYVFIAGPMAWLGLMQAHLHPALALVPIVPFLPGPKRDTGMFTEHDEVDEATALGLEIPSHHSPLHNFEHQLKLFVDLGLFFFAFSNAGVQFAGIGFMTWTILIALIVGKTVGIFACGFVADKIGFKLPLGMNLKDLTMAGFIAALGLTVALFVAAAAFTDPDLQGQAKMGALFSGFVGLVAILLGKMFGFGKQAPPDSAPAESASSAPTASTD